MIRLSLTAFLACFLANCIFPVRADQIVVPVVTLTSVNGTSAGGPNFNPLLGPSVCSKQMYPYNKPKIAIQSDDYFINGAVYTNCPSSQCNGANGIFVEVFPRRLNLEGNGSSVSLDLRGSIGGVPLSAGGQQSVTLQNLAIHPTLPWQANIQIIGDLDESTFSMDSRAGVYTGSFTIQTSKL